MTVERHLILQEITLRPSGEWSARGQGWFVAHILEGSGYWLNGGQARELNPGDGFVVAGGSPAIVRASQLGPPLRLQFFTVIPQYLNGLLTVGEGRQLESVSAQAARLVVVFAATEPLGQKFKHIAQLPPADSLALRCALLQLWSGAMAGLLQAAPAGIVSNRLRERFRDYIGHMSEAELASRALPELAREVHCSERHFSRLFREEFGEPLRARQIELRLQRARQLLLDSDDKIIHIAYESGYRHLGLFNAMFKKRFGVTPSEWRQQNGKRPPTEKKTTDRPGAAHRLALVAGWLLCACAWLAVLPARADSSATNRPAAPHGFTVKHYDIIGNTILPPAVIAKALTNSPGSFGTNVTFDGLRAALADLQLAYRERGFATVSVSLPQQKLTNATVLIKVTEGRLAAIRVTGNRYFSSNNVMQALPGLQTNMLLNSHVFQRELDTANTSRDRQIYPVISPGPDPGTTLLTLKVQDQLPFHSRLEVNNAYTPGTPDLRMAYNAQYDNLWTLEHQLGFAYSFTPVSYSHANDYSQSPFDAPLIANYSGYYQIPLGGYQPVQDQIDNQPSKFGYNEVTHHFDLPPASSRPQLTVYASRSRSDTGIDMGRSGYTTTPGIFTNIGTVYTPLSLSTNSVGENITLNENVGLKYSTPLPRLGNIASSLSLGLDLKRYQQTSYNTNVNYLTVEYLQNNNVVTVPQVIPQSQTPRQSGVDYFPLNAGWNGSLPDAHGATYFNTRADFNVFPISSENSDAKVARNSFAGVAYSPRAETRYLKLSAGADRVQTLYHDWSVKLHADGQWASTPLFSNEQFGMGGSGGVRGYSEGDFYGDTGWRVSIEPQTPMIDLGLVDGNIPFWVRSSVFMDYGQAFLIDKAATANPREDFWGVGWSLTANIGNHLDGRLAIACPLISTAQTPFADIHVYFGVGAQF